MILKAIGIALLSGIGGYVAGIFLGILLVNLFSSNIYDKSMEAGMTGFFVVGPLLALVAAIAGFVVYWQRLKAL
jgi:F0F1-type ATP synthase membrane subunit c/vacuolar-type H+-ATPase subunit K